MSYFKEITDYTTYSTSDDDFHFSYNANSGGGQAFLGGKFTDTDGNLASPETLNGLTSAFKCEYVNSLGEHVHILLNDPKAKYTIKPRGNGSTSMKLGIGNEREAPSRIISSFFMLPPTCGVKMSADLTHSILSSNNYWLLSMWLNCTPNPEQSEVHLIPRDYIFCGGANKANPNRLRYFKLDANQRIKDIIELSKNKNLFPKEISDIIAHFSDIYTNQINYKYDRCSQEISQLMLSTASEYPDRYSGISDPLPLLLEIAKEKQECDEYNSVEVEKSRITSGRNVLLYGVPGSGKSWTIEHEYCHSNSVVERLVFHPDYTNSDFIGQILPVVDKENGNQVTYEFTPGPFTTILRDAYKNPQKEFVLIIEEINRGNAPAIFGEVFQLLDRAVESIKSINTIYPPGTSEYGISHKNIAEQVYGKAHSKHKVRIPSNLSIIGTMNTSDQNVFTLDTAFQRRWQMRLIENSFDNVRSSLANAEILDTGVTWQRFCEVINQHIVGNKAKMSSSEDKRLGVYFVKESDLRYDKGDISNHPKGILAEYNELVKTEGTDLDSKENRERRHVVRTALTQNRIFPEKVIKYLWDDAFKFNPDAIFDVVNNKSLTSLESVIRLFVNSKGSGRFAIFKDSIQSLLLQPTNNP